MEKRIFNHLVAHHQRLVRKLERLSAVDDTKLHTIAKAKHHLQKRLNKLTSSLTRMQAQFKLATLAAVTAGAVMFTNVANGQILFDTAELEPFGLTGHSSHCRPALVDIDNDGDLDFIIGLGNGNFRYQENTGSATNPAFQTFVNNPFGLSDMGNRATPVMVDLDNDGDFDLLSGSDAGGFEYFENTGNAVNPAFSSPQQNPFGLASVALENSPAATDLDNDGDIDIMVCDVDHVFRFFENTGSADSAAFASALFNPFGLTSIADYDLFPTFVDLDRDGDMDLMVGDGASPYMNYFENTGSTSSPAFVAVQLNPFGLTNNIDTPAPTFADLNGDGAKDLIAGSTSGNIYYRQNISPKNLALAHHAFKYQAVVRDSTGNLIANQNIAVRLSLVSDSTNGSTVYVETHDVNTNNFGLASLSVGTGVHGIDIFDDIDWNTGTYFIKVEMDETGGSNYQPLSEAQLLSVPYALYAENVANESQDISLSGTNLTISSGSTIDLSSLQDGVDDADSDPSNEIQDISLSGTDLTISSGSTLDLSGLMDNLGNHLAVQNIELNNNWLSNDGDDEGLVVDSSGNVGMGILSPRSPLHVRGAVRSANSTSTNGGLIIQGTVDAGNGFNRGVISHNAVWDFDNDLWQIDQVGANDAQAILIPNNGGFQFVVHSSTGNTARTMTHTNFENGTKMTIRPSGNVGIGTTNPGEKLHVVGNICYTGSSASCSDLRYKKDITVLPNVLGKLEQINGVSYNWKVDEFPEKGFEDKTQIGVIAQELEAVYPELVITDADGYKTVDYPKLTAVLIEANKELKKELENQSASYKSRFAAQQQQINQIKTLLESQTQR